MQDAPTGSPLDYAPSPAHLAQLKQAKDLGKKLRRAVLVAKISGITVALFAAITLLTGFFDKPTFLLGVAMSIIAIVELRGAGALNRLDLQAPQRLALNQVAFGILLIAYAGWQLWVNLTSPSELASVPELKQAVGDLPGLERMIYLAVFFSIVLAALVGPGLTAIYYATRKKHLDAYYQQTAPWIVQLQQSGMEI